VPAELNQLPNSSVLHRLSTAFIYSRISVFPVGARIERDALAQETGRYVLPESVTLDAWRQAIARSLGQSAVRGFLKKRKDGVYETIPIGNALTSTASAEHQDTSQTGGDPQVASRRRLLTMYLVISTVRSWPSPAFARSALVATRSLSALQLNVQQVAVAAPI
jgi:hypothetical protein